MHRSPSAPAHEVARSLPGASQKSKRQREVYTLQVQAFLDAADEVDIDQDIAADILQGFDGDLNNGIYDEVDVEANRESSTGAAINMLDDEEDRDWGDGDDEGSELDALGEEGAVDITLMACYRCGRVVSAKHTPATRNWTDSRIVFSASGLKMSTETCIFLLVSLALSAWTHQEVRGMMHYLKERGKYHNTLVMGRELQWRYDQ